jgi:hypothetical protein
MAPSNFITTPTRFTGLDFVIVVSYVLLIASHMDHLYSHVAAIMGYTLLIVGKRLEWSRGNRDETVLLLRQAGVVCLIFTPSYDRWTDVFALVGYVYVLAGRIDDAIVPLSLYQALLTPVVTTPLQFWARAGLAVSLALGYSIPSLELQSWRPDGMGLGGAVR